jgi:hypothetical protein
MTGLTTESAIGLFLGAASITFFLFLMASSKSWSLMPPPKERDCASALADWARRRELSYNPQQLQVISGVYNNRWFAIRTDNKENALSIRMSVKNPRRNMLQIFGDWLEETEVTGFRNRFRIYSSPMGTGELLFENGTRLRESLLRFPDLRARLELFSETGDPNHLHYALLTDLPGADALEKIMTSMYRFCDAFEQQVTQEAVPVS